MISNNYKDNKAQVLKLYDAFVKLCETCGKSVDESIVGQAKRIQNEEFNLMVLGEAKSGKSTFINAFIGEEVLPMDVRQCTSAIIKIHRGNEHKLVATSASGGKSTVQGIDKIRDFLKEHAAISDKYRNIPVTTINNELLIRFKGKGVPQRVMADFLADEAKDNIFGINQEEYNALIKEYVAKHQSSWGKIVTEIDIMFPLPEEMQGITLIDSPGVGAGGNVGIIAEKYIKNANAIIFVKSLNGQALESSSFMNFLRNNSTNRTKESLFLILTGSSIPSGTEVNSLKSQALEMYGKDISCEKIVCVDSKIQLFLNQCLKLGEEEKIDAFYDELERCNDDFKQASYLWLKSKGNIGIFTEKMNEASNFAAVRRLIEKFARYASYIQLIEFLKNLLSEYGRYRSLFVERRRILEENLGDPVALEDRIRDKMSEIQDTNVKIQGGIQTILTKYTDDITGEGIIMKEADERRKKYEKQLENFRNLPQSDIDDSTFAKLKSITMTAVDDTKDFRREMADRIIAECNAELVQYTDDSSSIPAEAYNPNFTEKDFDEIDVSAKEKTSGVREVEDGVTFLKTTQKVPYHDLKKHVGLVSNSIHNRLEDIIKKMIDNVISYVNSCCEIYRVKLNEHICELEKEYQELLTSKENNDELSQKIEEANAIVTRIESNSQVIEAMRKELEQYVG